MKDKNKKFRLSQCEEIIDEEAFVDAHSKLIKKYQKKRPKFVKPYKERLELYYKIKNSK